VKKISVLVMKFFASKSDSGVIAAKGGINIHIMSRRRKDPGNAFLVVVVSSSIRKEGRISCSVDLSPLEKLRTAQGSYVIPDLNEAES